MTKLAKKSFIMAAGEVGYIMLVALLMRSAEKFLSSQPDNFFSPIAFLLLFVISAAVSSALIIGKPILLYLEDKKNEALKFFIFTLGWLSLFFLIAVVVMILM